MARTSGGASGGPTATAWDRSRSCWRRRTSPGCRRTEARLPSPVVTPYTVSPASTLAATTAREASIRFLAAGASATDSPRATATTSSTESDSPIRTVMARRLLQPGEADTAVARGGQRLFVARIGMTDDSHAGVRDEHPLEPPGRVLAPIGHHHHPGVDRIADPDTAAVVHAHPVCPRRGVEQRVQDRPVGDGIGPVSHPLRLPVRRRDASGVEMVTTDHDRRPQVPSTNQIVEDGARLVPLTVAQPTDASRQSLERHAILCHPEPPSQAFIVRK